MVAEQEALTIAEAAHALGISVYAVRRRIRAGELAAWQVPTKRGQAWRVSATLAPPLRDAGATVAEPLRHPIATVAEAEVEPPEILRLLDLVESQQQRIEEIQTSHAQTVMELAGRIGYYQAELEQVREQLALAAPKVEEPAEEASEAVTISSEPEQRPWWRFW
jgi:excisionase family DNA binding protein